MTLSLIARFTKSARNRLSVALLGVRAIRWRILSMLGVIRAGSCLKVAPGVDLTVYGQLRLGDRVHLDKNCSLQVGPGALLSLGSDSFVGQGTVIAANQEVVIGANVLIAEHCTIRDGDHQLDPIARRFESAHSTSPVRISNDVWIGAGVRVLKGSTVGYGAILAANAVVRGFIDEMSIAAGAPARVIKRLPSFEPSVKPVEPEPR